MLAMIKDDEKHYISQVLAKTKKKKFWDDKIIIFDKDHKSIKMVNLYHRKKIKNSSGYHLFNEAFIFDYEESDFVNTKKWYGLSIIIEDENIISRLERCDIIKISEINGLKNYVKEVEIPEWYELKTENDIKNLQMISNGFHDACLEYAIREDKTLILTFNTMDCIIHLKFINIIEENLENKIGEILASRFDLENNVFKWIILEGFGGWSDGVNYDIDASGSFIKCKKILWNFEFEF